MARRKIEVGLALDQHIQRYERASCGSAFPVGALAAAVLAATTVAHAEVVFTPSHQIVSVQNGPAFIDFNGDGIMDATITAKYSAFPPAGRIRPDSCSNSCSCFLRESLSVITLTRSNGVIANGRGFAVRGLAGQTVGPGHAFKERALMAEFDNSCRNHEFAGPWKNRPGEGFLGIRFQIEGAVHYGWVRLNHTSTEGGLMTGYAYETIPNKPIIAGSTSDGESESDMELPAGSLGSLAAGVAGR